MSFELIFLGKDCKPKNCNYIFDSNILLPQLGFPDPDNQYSCYLTFLSKVVHSIRKGAECRILLSPVQLSELFNKLLRYKAHIEWHKSGERKEGVSFGDYYKHQYRKSKNCQKDFEVIKSDFEEIEDIILLRNLEALSITTCLDFDSNKLDYNDNYLYTLAKETCAICVSHDKDFYDLPQLRFATFNNEMYKWYKNDIFKRKWNIDD